jgi:hypothetical protein
MANLWYFFSVRDNSSTGLGAPVTGLTPSWALFNTLDTNITISPTPAIVEVGHGIYKYSYDTEASGEVAGQIDALGGKSTPALQPGDRYIDQFPTREASRLLTAINSVGQVVLSPAGLEAVQVESGVNARQALSPILAASAGVLIGAGTGTIVVKGGNVTTTRITATTDNAGNRSAVTLTLPTPLTSGMFPSSYFTSSFFPSSYFSDGSGSGS